MSKDIALAAGPDGESRQLKNGFVIPCVRSTRAAITQQTHRKLVYRPLQFHERSPHFIGAHDETLSVAMRVKNSDRSPFDIQTGGPVQTPSGITEIVSDDLPILHAHQMR